MEAGVRSLYNEPVLLPSSPSVVIFTVSLRECHGLPRERGRLSPTVEGKKLKGAKNRTDWTAIESGPHAFCHRHY